MSSTKEELYWVVVNHEDQYSIWPSTREVPAGWTRDPGADPAPKAECLDYIERTWTDMRPRSVREAGSPTGGERAG